MNPGEPQHINMPVLSYTCHNAPMTMLAANLPGLNGAQGYFDNKPVVDQTDLKGNYDFTLTYTPKLPAVLPPGLTISGESIPLFEALDKQLGLQIEAAHVDMPVIMVDSAIEKPTENPPAVEKAFPPPPSEFDVAEIKPSAPSANAGGGRGGGQPMPEIKNGRVMLPGITLDAMIMAGWDLSGPDAMVGAPKWINDDKFDVIAKAPAGVQVGDLMAQTQRSMPINLEVLRPMLRNLLIERFKMVVHMEQRPMDAYTLVAVKPKLQKADPNARTKWAEGPAETPRSAQRESDAGTARHLPQHDHGAICETAAGNRARLHS